MNIVGSMAQVAIAAADALERTAGPKAALAAWKRLAWQNIGADARATAVLRALDCATRLDDATVAGEMIALWSEIVEGDRFTDVAQRCTGLARDGKRDTACALAAAEAQRNRSARALYLHTRCLELAGDSSCTRVATDAAERAVAEGLPEIAAAARVRHVAWLARSFATLPIALAEAPSVDASRLGARDRLALAEVLLRAPSRFSRASGLDLLDRTAAASGASLARAAVTRAFAHADDSWPRLSALEVDRLLAMIGRLRDTQAAERTRVALREVLDARATAEPDEASRLALTIVASLEGSRPADAIDALSAAAMRIGVERRAPCTMWTAAEAALRSDEASVRERAHDVARRLLEVARSVPPRGFVALASALDAAGFVDTAIVAARGGVAQKEPSAPALLGELVRARGWALAQQGARIEALEALREAKGLLHLLGDGQHRP